MIKNCWFVLGALFLSASVLAQQSTNPPPAASDQPAAVSAASTNAVVATDTNAPVAKAEKKKSKKKREKTTAQKEAAELKTVPLVAGPATVIASNVNVRGLAGLKGEVLTRVNKGQTVTVLEEITLKKSAPDEPSAWAKILLPPGAHTWVSSAYIDPTNKTVLPKKLKIRAGPSENYSMLGILERGDPIKEVTTKGEWTEIEPPQGAYAFVAAQYLQQEAPGTVAASQEAVPAPVTEPPAVAAAPTEAPATPAVTTNAPTETAAAATAPQTEPPAEEPPPKRIVEHEGVVRGTFSIQAPTHFELVSPESGRTINYLYTTSPLLDLQRYKGLRIVVTGEEGLDERWRNTPIITIQKIQVVE
jgi:uncharacterized protein YgiM (DUF1202 family)